MAYANWLKVTPTSGSGNDSVSVSTHEAHTGRNARNTVVTFKASGVSDEVVNVNQAGKPEFVTFESAKAINKEGGTVTIEGVSNSKKLTFSLGSGDLAITLPNSYLANSITTQNGKDIAGDPGGQAEYDFSTQITVPANTGVDTLTKQVTVTADGGQSKTATLTQAAGDAMLSVSPKSISLTWEGTAETITVTSNTTWTVE